MFYIITRNILKILVPKVYECVYHTQFIAVSYILKHWNLVNQQGRLTILKQNL